MLTIKFLKDRMKHIDENTKIKIVVRKDLAFLKTYEGKIIAVGVKNAI